MNSKVYPIDRDDLQAKDIFGQSEEKRARNEKIVRALFDSSVAKVAEDFNLSRTRILQIWQYTYVRQFQRKGQLY